ncbi:MAG: hypothetical protein JXL97_20265 [Bacteroidales bacterium]|nr:hypothetical protein [Bacteroidales bacterium]
MKRNTVLIISLLLIFGCETKTKEMAKSNLPKDIKNIEITWNENGGMLFYIENVKFTKDSCSYEKNIDGAIQHANFTISEKQLEDLYSVFVKNEFDLIKTYQQPVTDRGGSSITLKVNEQNFSVSNAGSSFIEKEYSKNYNGVESEILKLTKEEVDKQKKEITISFDETITNSEQKIKLFINRDIVFDEQAFGGFQPITVKLLNDNNIFVVTFNITEENKTVLTEKSRLKNILPELPNNGQVILYIDENGLLAFK